MTEEALIRLLNEKINYYDKKGGKLAKSKDSETMETWAREKIRRHLTEFMEEIFDPTIENDLWQYRDFFDALRRRWPKRYIVCNPPYSKT